jgi:hypothetical protein
MLTRSMGDNDTVLFQAQPQFGSSETRLHLVPPPASFNSSCEKQNPRKCAFELTKPAHWVGRAQTQTLLPGLLRKLLQPHVAEHLHLPMDGVKKAGWPIMDLQHCLQTTPLQAAPVVLCGDSRSRET